MSRYNDKEVTKTDMVVIAMFMIIGAILVHYLLLKEAPKPPVVEPPPEYNLLCKKNFSIPTKFNLVLECMHIRTKGG